MNRPDNPIRQHVFSIPELIRLKAAACFEDVRKKLALLDTGASRQIILTGCGYSYAACMAVKDALAECTKRQVLVLPAMEAARFLHAESLNSDNTLLVAVSSSGAVSRINEVVLSAQKHGIRTIGLTASMESVLAQQSDFALDISSPPMARQLPLRGYIMTVLTLLAMGETIAEDMNERVLTQLKATADAMELRLPAIDEQVYAYCDAARMLRVFEYVGAGYERAAAFLGKIEMMGQAGLPAIEEDSEQWCHCNFFMAEPEKIGSVLFLAHNAAGFSRGCEVLGYMEHLGRPVCLATDDASYMAAAQRHVVYLPQITPVNAGIIEMTVPSLITGYFCDFLGERYSRGFREPWAMFRTGCGTCESKIEIR